MVDSQHVHTFARIWFLTWTTYGTWLPGDNRGFVSPKFERSSSEKRNNIPGTRVDAGRTELRRLAAAKLKSPPVVLIRAQAEIAHRQFVATAEHRGWVIISGAVVVNHVHLLVGVSDDPDPADLMRDFKAYASRSLNQSFERPASGTWWTEQGSKRLIKDRDHLEAVRRYVRNQHGSLVVWESTAR